MALTDQQKKLAKDIAALVGVALKQIPEKEKVAEYVQLMKTEIDTVASASDKPTPKEIAKVTISVADDIAEISGNKKFQRIMSFAKGVLNLFGG